MHHPTSIASVFLRQSVVRRPVVRQPAVHQPVARRIVRWVPSFFLGILMGVWTGDVSAQTAPSAPLENRSQAEQIVADNHAPPEILQILTQIDAAASQADLAGVMSFYSPNFRTTDGLTYDRMEQVLTELWERYPNLTYQTQLNSWEADGMAIVVETTTTITGSQTNNDRPQTLTSTITSRQRFENSLIVEQEILAEQTQVAIGSSPPVVEILLPEQVTIGQPFEFDAIVQEPLGNRLLLGAAIDERVEPESYFSSVPVSLEVLSSGGLFKVGRAPATADSHWVSGVLIREDGITTVTQRLQIVRPETAGE